MYWSVLGCIVAVEYVAEWLIFWYVDYLVSCRLLTLGN